MATADIVRTCHFSGCEYFLFPRPRCNLECFFRTRPEPVPIREEYPLTEDIYKAIVVEAAGTRKSERSLDRISQDYPDLTSLFRKAATDPDILKQYFGVLIRKRIERGIKAELEKHEQPLIVLGNSCYYQRPSMAHSLIGGLATAVKVVKDIY